MACEFISTSWKQTHQEEKEWHHSVGQGINCAGVFDCFVFVFRTISHLWSVGTGTMEAYYQNSNQADKDGYDDDYSLSDTQEEEQGLVEQDDENVEMG